MNVQNYYINSNKLRPKKPVDDWTTETKLSSEEEITRLKAIIENCLGCETCKNNPTSCDYNFCISNSGE